MIKNLAFFLAFVLVVVLFQPQIKAAIVEFQFGMAMSGLEVEEEQLEALRALRDRIGSGYRVRAFTDQERLTLSQLRAELSSLSKADSVDPRAVDSVIGRHEAILRRHRL